MWLNEAKENEEKGKRNAL